MSGKVVLSTRKHEQSDIDLFRSNGYKLITYPLLTFEYSIPDAGIKDLQTQKSTGWIVTSKNGARGLLKLLESGARLPNPEMIVATGPKTAEPLAGLDKDVYVPETQNAGGIARFIIENRADLNWIHFCGNLTRPELGQKLQDYDIGYQTVEVYQTMKAPELPDTLPLADAVMFYSPSAVSVWFKHFPEYINSNRPVCVAIGPTTRDAFKSFTRHNCVMAEQPNISAMLEAVRQSTSHDSLNG